MKTEDWDAMKSVLSAMVIASQLISVAYAQKGGKAKTETQSQITYQANELGGYNFIQDGRRIAYSKPETGTDWTTQILYVCPNATNKMAPKKDTPAIKVTPKEIVSLDVFALYKAVLGEWWVLGNGIEDRFALVLREKPDAEVKTRRVLPDAPEGPGLPSPDLSKFVSISAARREITIKATGRTLKYFPNKVGGYTFTHDGTILLYSKAYDGPGFSKPMQFGSQSVWMNRPHNEDLLLATLSRSSDKDFFWYRGRSIADGMDVEDVLLAIQPILEQPNTVQPAKTIDDHWRELLGKP
jgi:hypothetical protein